MSTIKRIVGREVLDSRGNPTVEVDVLTAGGVCGSAMVPSGASTGSYEAVELRDGDKKRYLGKGVSQAASNVTRKISEALTGLDPADQRQIDDKMIALDGTENKGALGANAILGVSMACARAAAIEKGEPLYRHLAKLAGCEQPTLLPVPMMNIINGGAHADNNVDIQEFMIAPTGFERFEEALRAGVEVFHALKGLLKAKGHQTAVGDEGGCAPNLARNEEAFALIAEATEKAGYKLGEHMHFACDAASTEFYKDGTYQIDGGSKSAAQLTDYYAALSAQYPAGFLSKMD